MCLPASSEDNVKIPNVAGTFYPADATALSRDVDAYLSSGQALPSSDAPALLISPHAGYAYSGSVAGAGFRAVSARRVRTVIVIGPSHYFPFAGVSVWQEGAFRTPLGDVPVDSGLAKDIMSFDATLFTFRKDVFEREHSIETQLPFIQRVFPGAAIVPVIVGQPDPAVSKALAEALLEAVGERADILIVVSSDQSHFHADAEARRIDQRGLDAVTGMDVAAFWQGHVTGAMEVDAFHVVTALMLYAKARDLTQVNVIRYATSADATGDKSRVVGYAAVTFEKGKPLAGQSLTGTQKKRLLQLARQVLTAFVTSGKVIEPAEDDPHLLAEEGAFVTLRKKGSLRGCIGRIVGDGPLALTVRDMAISAASEDPRFSPVTVEELSEIDIEISVLSLPQVVKRAEDIELGRHGVIVRKGARGGVFLPQVATETGWNREKFLSELCSQKAGLPADCWKDPSTTLEVFTADVFEEKQHR